MNKIYELKTVKNNEGIKIMNNTPIMFCYSDVPLKLKNDEN